MKAIAMFRKNHSGINHTQLVIHAEPTFETLEKRVLLSGTTYTVNSLADVVADDGVVTLREAIEAANTNTAVTGDVEAGSDSETDIITFDQTALSAEAGVEFGQPLTITLGGTKLHISEDLDIQGFGQDQLILDANGESQVIYIYKTYYGDGPEVHLADLTITGGTSTNQGGGIWNSRGKLILADVTIEHNQAESGGGIYTYYGTLEILNLTLKGNSAERGGGIYNYYGDLTLANSIIVGNSATDGSGGGIYSSNSLALINSTVAGNSATGSGGGVCNYSNSNQPVTINNSIVAINTSSENPNIYGEHIYQHSLIGADPQFVRNPGDGGDGWADDPSTYNLDESANNDYGDLRPTNISFAINQGINALAVDGNEQALSTDIAGNPRITGEQVDIGAFEYQGTPSPLLEIPSTIVTTTLDVLDPIDGSISLREAVWYNELLNENIRFADDLSGQTITLQNQPLLINHNISMDASSLETITLDGNGQNRVIYVNNPDAEVQLVNLAITGGYTDMYGGGILNLGVLTLTDVAVKNNTAAKSLKLYAGRGGGIYNAGTMFVNRSIVSDNFAGDSGGGIYNSYSSDITLTNSVVIANTADSHAGGINNYGTGKLINSTVTGNLAVGSLGGGGIYNGNYQLILDNSIVALNSSPTGIDVVGKTTSHHSLIGIDPNFVRNPDDGGDGWIDDPGTLDIDESANNDYGDLRLQGISIAVNAGDNSLAVDSVGGSLIDDMQGNARINDGQIDIGAYEYQGAVSPQREAAATLVTITDDIMNPVDGEISLREAIFYSQLIDGEITFSPALSAATFTLAGLPLRINHALSINATSVDGVTIDGNGLSGVMSVENSEGNVTLEGITITGGASRNGGGISNYGSLLLTDCTVINNTATDNGGGIYGHGGTLILTNSTVTSNNSSSRGGGIDSSGYITLIQSTISDNNAEYGGGLYVHGSLEAEQSTVTGNSAEDYGGGVYCSLRYKPLSGLTVTNNNAYRGGGIYVKDSEHSVIKDMTLSGNTAVEGGGIYMEECEITLTNLTLTSNSAQYGGAVFTDEISDSLLLNAVVVGNTTAYTGCIHVFQGALTIINSVIAANDGQGVYGSLDCALSLVNSIITFNTIDLFGSLAGMTQNLIGGDPQFVRNPFNGGDGWIDNPDTLDINEADNNDYGDLRLRPTSPAIDAGHNDSLPDDYFDLDQDEDDREILPIDFSGFERIINTYVDIGAYEFGSNLPQPNGDFNFDGVVGLLDLDILGQYFYDNDENKTKSMGDANGDGMVNILDLDILGETWGMNAMAMPSQSTATSQQQNLAGLAYPGQQTAVVSGFHQIDNLLADEENAETVVLF